MQGEILWEGDELLQGLAGILQACTARRRSPHSDNHLPILEIDQQRFFNLPSAVQHAAYCALAKAGYLQAVLDGELITISDFEDELADIEVTSGDGGPAGSSQGGLVSLGNTAGMVPHSKDPLQTAAGATAGAAATEQRTEAVPDVAQQKVLLGQPCRPGCTSFATVRFSQTENLKQRSGKDGFMCCELNRPAQPERSPLRTAALPIRVQATIFAGVEAEVNGQQQVCLKIQDLGASIPTPPFDQGQAAHVIAAATFRLSMSLGTHNLTFQTTDPKEAEVNLTSLHIPNEVDITR